MAYQEHVVQIKISMFRRRITETGILSNFVKIVGAGPSPKQRQRNSKVSLNKEIEQIFWVQDLRKLQNMHPSNPVCTCNLLFLECFQDSGNPSS